MSSKDLPSIDDFAEDSSNLPSIDEFITEEVEEDLPSVEDFIEKEKEIISEQTQTIEDANGESFAEIQDIVPPWPELVRMINDVRADIPDIPEVKYYDKELEELAERISNLPEVRYYDGEVEAICDQIDLVREQIKGLPEVKYYDEQVDIIEDRIDTLQTEVANLPEVKYYDSEIAAICESIDAVKASIPKFPKWINEVNEVPDFSWIGKTFSVIEDDFIKVRDKIEGLRGKVDFDLDQLSEDVETKYFNNTVKIENDISNLSEKVDTRIDEEKDKIWKELRSSSLKMWEYHKEFKDDDRKLKKQILGEYNTLKQNINKELKEINYTSTKTDELLLKYFTELREEISGLPEVKYYDKDIDYVKSDIKGLYKIVEDIKSSQKQLKEEQKLLAETNVPLGEDPPETDNSDPLTPLNQDFVTLDQLQKHYKIFVERVQYQLASIGGGGAGFIKDLDDVDITGLANNYILQYDSSVSKWKTVVNNAGAAGTWATTSVGIHTTKNVGIATTARSNFALYVEGNQYVDGNITVGGTITYDDVKNVDSLGIITARTGIDVLAGGINVVGVSTISTGIGTVRIGVGNTTLFVDGDARITGILTIGTGSITLDPTSKKIEGIDEIIIGTANTITIKQDAKGDIEFTDSTGSQKSVGIGTTVSINTSGIITATSFSGDGSGLTGVASTDFIITGTAATFNNKVFVGTAITMEPGSGGGINVTGVITATSFQGDGSNLSGISTGTVRTVNIITATDGQTLFPATGTISYDVGYVDVYINGVKQATGVDYTGTSGTSITLTSGVVADDTVEIVAFTSLDNINTDIVLDTTPQLGGNLDLNSKTINGTGDVNITGVITATTFNGSLATSNLSGTVTNDQLAGSIANAKLANSSIAIGGVTLNLGDTDATPAFDLSDATDYPFTSLTGITTVISGDTTPTLGGNLDANSNDITGINNINVSGVSTFTSTVEIKPDSDVKGLIIDGTNASLGNNPLITLRGGGPNGIDFRDSNNSNGLKIVYRTTANQLLVEDSENTTSHLKIDKDDGRVELNYGGSKKFETTNTGVVITGIATATSFVGNITGDVTGNADTATTLATARTIGGVSFDGSSSINLPGVNQSGTQNTSGTAAGLSGSPDIAVTNITSGIVTATTFVGALTGSATGLTGTPNITVGSITAASAEFSGNVTIGGTLTYEDVTNIDSIGIVTARTGVRVTEGGLVVTAGVSTFSGNVNIVDGVKALFGNGNDLEIYHAADNASYIRDVGSGNLNIDSTGGNIQIRVNTNESAIVAKQNGAVDLYYDNSKKFETTNDGVVVTGICTASAFVDDGTNLLTEINTKASTGKAIAMAMVFG